MRTLKVVGWSGSRVVERCRVQDAGCKGKRRKEERDWKSLLGAKAGRRPSPARLEPCINGQVGAVGAYFGQAVGRIIDRLLTEQLPDGGWNCEAANSSTWRVCSYQLRESKLVPPENGARFG